ncbi:MAG: hypothetical protein A3I66_22250 [Burkholderiales bacterium RIFCSPLOWO2_02_FULL_57_36]|nr:MAG: hypothetical protein A3I66_22250 [Burkholderiales bacterium RIFCSPLOWO2_02_FULL_57_36]
MNDRKQAGTTKKQSLVLTDPMRRDIVRAYAIEIAISIAELIGTRRAAAFLRKYMVDIDVALRVLLHPSQRRNYDSQDKFALEGILPVL